MKSLLLMTLMHVAVIANAQLISILDSKTKQPIPYATIRSINVKAGDFTNEDGKAQLADNMKDSLLISSIGYQSRLVLIKNIRNDTILLERLVSELPTVTIRSLKPTGEQTLGISNANKFIIWGSGGYGDEFAQKIIFPDSAKTYRLKVVSIGAERFVADIPVILHVYDVGENGLPGKDILLERVLLTKEQFKRSKEKFIIDISSQNIQIDKKACFIGVEWLPVRQLHTGCTAIILTKDLSESITYTRSFFFYNNEWKQAPYLGGKEGNPNNTIISVRVDVLE